MFSTDRFWINRLFFRLIFNIFLLFLYCWGLLFLSFAFFLYRWRYIFFSRISWYFLFLFTIFLPKLTQTIINIEAIFIIYYIFLSTLVWYNKYFSFAGGDMHIIIFVVNRFFAEFTWSRSRLALFKMQIKLFVWNIKLAVCTIFRLHITFLKMLIFFFFLERFCTIFTFRCIMKLLFMFLQKIFIVHLATYLTFYDISSAIAKMGGRFRGWDIF